MQPSTRRRVPGIVEGGIVTVLDDSAAQDSVITVGCEGLVMVLLDLVDVLYPPEAPETLAIRVKHITHKVGGSKSN